MELCIIEIISVLITLLAMPFVTRGDSWMLKALYIGLCGFLLL